jgi:amino acid transporter
MNAAPPRKLGTFLGVYTPTVLTILGVIMYLRTGWVVGNLGLARTLGIVVIANLITLVTTLSFSAMATNIRVGAGGAYFIISRSLGLGVGGAVGLPLFLSQALSVTLYAFGLAESLRFVLPGLPVGPTAAVIIVLVAAVSYRGAELALKSQVPLLVLVGLSVAALGLGVAFLRSPTAGTETLSTEQVDSWLGFAVFFPAVTGIMAGLSLSGDLKKPERSIPLGAILATLTGFGVYLAVPALLSAGAEPGVLRDDPLVWSRIALGGAFLVLPGLWGAILSSAVGSMLGAPRTLQALARDHLSYRIDSRFLAGEAGLRIGLFITLAIALATVLLGGLNAVAPVVSMFFLTVYGTINLVAALETLSGDPSWRPRLRIPWFVSLAGAAACAWVMFLISPLASVVAIAIEALLWMVFVRREQQAHWGDARRGLYEAMVRWALVRLAARPMSKRNWRPHVLVFVDDPEKRLSLVRFGCWFAQERGVVTVCELVEGDLLADDPVDLRERRAQLQAVYDREDLTVFAETDMVRDVVEGMTNVTQANGMAGLTSNTVLLGWPREPARMALFLETVRRLERLRKSVVIGRADPARLPTTGRKRRRVHVWWGGLQQNGDLMLLLAYLLTRNAEWRGAELKILNIASNEFARNNTERYLKELLPELRIDAAVHVMLKPPKSSVRDVIRMQSSGADVVFFGLATPDEGEEEAYAQRLEELAGHIPVVFLVKNSSLFVGNLVKPEELEAPEEPERIEADPD